MTPLKLFLISRRAGATLAAIVISIGVARLILALRIVSANDPASTTKLMACTAAAVGALIAVSTSTPFPELEHTVAFPLARFRAVQIGFFCLVGWIGLHIVFQPWQHAPGSLLIGRNVAGLAGLSLLGACLAGSRFGWILPMVFAVAVYLSAAPDGTSSNLISSVSTWSLRPADDLAALSIAGALLIVGLVWYLGRGAPSVRGM